MKLVLKSEGERLVVVMNGRLDEEAAGQLCDHLLALDTKPYREVALEIAGVSYIGSAGIARLIALHNHLAGQGSALRLINPPGHIYDLFESMRLDKLFCMRRN